MPFEPTPDPNGGPLWDLDDNQRHCCNDCHCPSCLVGHYPDQDCPSTPDPADTTTAREAAIYGDPDARYDALRDACLGDCD